MWKFRSPDFRIVMRVFSSMSVIGPHMTLFRACALLCSKTLFFSRDYTDQVLFVLNRNDIGAPVSQEYYYTYSALCARPPDRP